MPVQQPVHSRGAPDARLLVSRQPVLDGRDSVIGYRLPYAVLEHTLVVVPGPDEMLELVDDLLAVIGHDEQSIGTMAHLPVSRAMLLEHGLPPVRRDRALLRIRYDDATLPEVRALLAAEAIRGCALELDGLPGPSFDPSLLDPFTAVELDLPDWAPAAVPAVVAQIRAHGAIPLAASVHDHGEREQARALGFEWFTGPFFATPNLLAGRPLPVGDLRTLGELAALQRAEAPLEQLITVIERDLGLGVRLLRYINSAYFGLAGRVRSIAHAAAMLGSRGLARWALVAAVLGGSEPIHRELALLALTRARTCELVGVELGDLLAGDELFTVGLLSTLDAVMRLPIGELVGELPLSDQVANALTAYDGPAGEILSSVICYERGDFRDPTFGRDLMIYASAYRAGLAWAREALGGTD